MLVFVLDTSSVADLGLRRHLGASSLEETVSSLAELLKKVTLKHEARFYVTPLMMEELRNFLLNNGVSEETVNRFAAWLVVKSPSLHDVKIPAAVMASYVEEFQKRLTKGLKVAEEVVKKAAQGDTDLGQLIRALREKYREATRHGVVDSAADFGAAILSLEVNGIMVTSDDGIKKLCNMLGVMVVSAEHFADMLQEYASV